MRTLGLGIELSEFAVRQDKDDPSLAGSKDVILLALSSGDEGLLLTDGTSFLKLAEGL